VFTGSTGFTDPVGRTLTYSAPATTAGGATVTVDPTTGVYTYTPTSDQRLSATSATRDTFTVNVSNGVNTATRTISVYGSWLAGIPVAGTPTAGTPAQDSGAVTGAAAFTDPAGRTLTYSTAGTSTAGGTVTVDANTGDYTYTPTLGQRRTATANTTDTFTVTASNGVNSTYQTVTVAIAGATLRDLVRGGVFDSDALAIAGFDRALAQALIGGNGVAGLKGLGFSASDLKGAGFTAAELAADFTLRGLVAAGFVDGEALTNAGFDSALTQALIGGTDVAGLKGLGFSAVDLKVAGFSASDLQGAGYTISQLKVATYDDAAILRSGFVAADLKAAEYQASDLKGAGFSAVDLKGAGFTLRDLVGAGFFDDEVLAGAGFDRALAQALIGGNGVAGLKGLGFTAADLKGAGYGASELAGGGFSLRALAGAGYTQGELVDSGVPNVELAQALIDYANPTSNTVVVDLRAFTPVDLRTVGFSASELKDAGFSLLALAGAGFSADDLYAAGVPRDIWIGNTHFAQALIDGMAVADLAEGGVSAASLRTVGFTADELKQAGFSLVTLAGAGFSASELEAAGVPTAQGYTPSGSVSLAQALIDVYSQNLEFGAWLQGVRQGDVFGPADLRTVGFTAGELKVAGFSLLTLAGAGYSADNLVAAGVPVFSVGSSTFADALIHDGTSPTWSAAELAATFKAAEVEPAELRFVGFSATELATGGYSLRILAGAGFSAAELYAAGVPWVEALGSFPQALIDGISAASLQAAGVGATDMRTVGYSISDLQGANYTEEQILNAGFSAAELAQAGLPSGGGNVSSGLQDAVITPTYIFDYPAVFVYLPTLRGRNMQVSISSSSGANFYVLTYTVGGPVIPDESFQRYYAYYASGSWGSFGYFPGTDTYAEGPVGYTFRDFYSSYLSSKDVDTFIVLVFEAVLDDLQLVVYDGVSKVGSVLLNPPPPQWS
jgi:VCBS repeat-containing protein